MRPIIAPLVALVLTGCGPSAYELLGQQRAQCVTLGDQQVVFQCQQHYDRMFMQLLSYDMAMMPYRLQAAQNAQMLNQQTIDRFYPPMPNLYDIDIH